MKFIFTWLLGLSGWTLIDKPLPEVKRAICLFAPHTSNWDFVVMVAAKFAWGMKVRYLGKHSLFKWPYGWFFKALGGIPVVRNRQDNLVGQVVDLIASEENILLAIAPEGTRSYTPYWKTGFYHIAERSELPLVLFYLDNKTKTIGFSDVFIVTGDLVADMQKISEFYADKESFYPDKTSLVQTRKQYQLAEKANDNLK